MAGPLQYRLSLLGECSRNPSVSVYQLALWEAMFDSSGFVCLFVFSVVVKTLSVHLSISWWVIYDPPATCPHCSECSSVFHQNVMTPLPYPPYSPDFTTSTFLLLLFPWMKNVLKGKCSQWGRGKTKQKMVEALNDIKINEFKNCFEQWKKPLDRCIASNGECFEGDWSLNMYE